MWKRWAFLGFLAFLAIVTFALLQPGFAPSRPITIVLGVSKGGITDVIVRQYAELVSGELGQPIVIDNRPTDSGVEAAAMVQNASPDGQALLAFSGAQHAALPAMRRVSYDPVDGFAPVTTLFTLVNFLAVPQQSPVDSVAELLAEGRSKPAGLVFGSSGIGSTSHLTAMKLAVSTSTPIRPVHHAGAAAMIDALVSGQLDFALVSYTVAKPHVLAGRLKLLAVDAEERWPDLPQVPTLREAGVEQEKVASWFALAAPAGTPEAVIARLQAAFASAAMNPVLIQAARESGAVISTSSPQDLQAMLGREVDATGSLVRTLDLHQ
jgi:tripartite-type tricarboxylate transporter receptor subunit TctC